MPWIRPGKRGGLSGLVEAAATREAEDEYSCDGEGSDLPLAPMGAARSSMAEDEPPSAHESELEWAKQLRREMPSLAGFMHSC